MCRKQVQRRREMSLLAALSNDVRLDLMRRLRDEKDAISPTQLAQEFGKPLSTVAYHLRILFAAGALSLVKTEPRRGAIKHFYKSSVRVPWAMEVIDHRPWPLTVPAEQLSDTKR